VPELLLLSNSVGAGQGFLEHALDEIAQLAAPGSSMLFVPYASSEPDRYTDVMRTALAAISVHVDGAQTVTNAVDAMDAADAVFVGGGNTFRLVQALHATGLMAAIRDRVAAGMPYLGASAGSNIACPTIRTTNDMPIVQPVSFDGLALVPFQINPHYAEPDPASTHQGETRAKRIAEFLEHNDAPVLGLREGSWLRVSGPVASVGGTAGGVLFTRGTAQREIPPGTDVSELLAVVPRFDCPL
jgi:dipeptidase E